MALFLMELAGETSLKRISYQQGRAEHAMRFFHASNDLWRGATARGAWTEVISMPHPSLPAFDIPGILPTGTA